MSMMVMWIKRRWPQMEIEIRYLTEFTDITGLKGTPALQLGEHFHYGPIGILDAITEAQYEEWAAGSTHDFDMDSGVK